MESTVTKDNQTEELHHSLEIKDLSDGSDKAASSVVNMQSNISTPSDPLLPTHLQNLRSEMDNLKLNICKALKLDIEKFGFVTPNMIKNCSTLTKCTIAEGMLSMLSLSEKVCAHVNVSGSKSSDSTTPVTEETASGESVSSLNSNDQSMINQSLQALHKKMIGMMNQGSEHIKTMKLMKVQLDNLVESVNSFKNGKFNSSSAPDITSFKLPSHNSISGLHSEADCEGQPKHVQTFKTEHSIKHIDSYKPDFIDNETSSKLLKFIEQYASNFEKNTETGHGVISFGEMYEYTGAKAIKPVSKVIPEPLMDLAARIKKCHPEAVINQCLINSYPDKNSRLPKHSDNEESIVHDSHIFTVSLGAGRNVTFSKIDGSISENEVTESIQGNSLYAMSKLSQTVWEHRIDPCDDDCGLRYSITFRYISKNNRNATIVLGDSNTTYLRFGSGKGNFGDQTPGKRVECYTIEKIDPSRCIGYRNIFIHCGINNIKKHRSNVEECTNMLIQKLESICELCPYSKITVSPILPTKISWLNEKALLFNHLLFQYSKTNSRIGTLDFNGFVNSDGLLDNEFGRYHNSDDPIHLGSNGIFKLSRLIIGKIRDNPTDGRLYSEVTENGVSQYNMNVPNTRVSTSPYDDY